MTSTMTGFASTMSKVCRRHTAGVLKIARMSRAHTPACGASGTAVVRWPRRRHEEELHSVPGWPGATTWSGKVSGGTSARARHAEAAPSGRSGPTAGGRRPRARGPVPPCRAACRVAAPTAKPRRCCGEGGWRNLLRGGERSGSGTHPTSAAPVGRVGRGANWTDGECVACDAVFMWTSLARLTNRFQKGGWGGALRTPYRRVATGFHLERLSDRAPPFGHRHRRHSRRPRYNPRYISSLALVLTVATLPTQLACADGPPCRSTTAVSPLHARSSARCSTASSSRRGSDRRRAPSAPSPATAMAAAVSFHASRKAVAARSWNSSARRAEGRGGTARVAGVGKQRRPATARTPHADNRPCPGPPRHPRPPVARK